MRSLKRMAGRAASSGSASLIAIFLVYNKVIIDVVK